MGVCGGGGKLRGGGGSVSISWRGGPAQEDTYFEHPSGKERARLEALSGRFGGKKAAPGKERGKDRKGTQYPHTREREKVTQEDLGKKRGGSPVMWKKKGPPPGEMSLRDIAEEERTEKMKKGEGENTHAELRNHPRSVQKEKVITASRIS